MNHKYKLTTKDIVYIGLFSAMCAAATYIKVPFGVGAMVHLGTGVIFLVAILYGGVYAGLSGAIGSAIFDLIMGFSPYTMWSFIIKGISGLIAGVISKGLWPESSVSGKNWLLRSFSGCVLAALWTLGGYIIAWWQVTGALATAIANIPGSLMTSTMGLIVAFLLSPKIRSRLNKQN